MKLLLDTHVFLWFIGGDVITTSVPGKMKKLTP